MNPPALPQDHPEKASDEYFIGNANERMLASERFTRFKTLRIGSVAYSRDNRPLEQSGWFPVFVKQDEWDNAQSRLF